MEPFSAVRTTGIYCRPGCPARPLPANVGHFALPAAAEAAGYRACLRCRPYRTDAPLRWSGPEVVCRGVQLIVDGALDGRSEDALGARLGVSARHLRRLFREQLGITPDQLARSRRAHFARRLLDDTDLTLIDVATAAGFGSVRQFNRTCREVFRAAPGELRARRRVADRLVADGGLSLRLAHHGPLDWPHLLDYLAERAIPGVEHVDGDTYRRTILVDGDPGVLELRAGDGGDRELLLRAHLPHWEGLIHVVQRARRIANLDADTEAAATHLGDDPLLGPLLVARPGLRPPGTWDPFETGVRVIVGQQVSVVGATTIAGRLAQRFGTHVPGLGPVGLGTTFPAPESLAEGDLGGLGLTATRQAAVRGFARAVAEDRVRLDRSLRLDELVAAIVAVPGLGPWTAHCIALRLGEPDAFPAGDLGLRRVLAHSVGPRVDPERRSQRWRPWRAHAAIHLWTAGSPGQVVSAARASATWASTKASSRGSRLISRA